MARPLALLLLLVAVVAEARVLGPKQTGGWVLSPSGSSFPAVCTVVVTDGNADTVICRGLVPWFGSALRLDETTTFAPVLCIVGTCPGPTTWWETITPTGEATLVCRRLPGPCTP